MPAATTVVGGDDRKFAVDRVAQGKTSAMVEERHAVVEGPRVLVFERQLPAGAAVGCAIDLRILALPNRQHHGVVAVERLDVTKLHLVPAGWGDILPGPAAINGTHRDSGSATATASGPHYVPADDADRKQDAGGARL